MQAGGLQDPPVIEIKQGLILQGKHRKTAHQGVGKGDLDIAGPVIGHLGEIVADGGEQGVAVEMSTHFDVVEGPGSLTVPVDQALEGRHGFLLYNILKLHRKNDSALLAMSREKQSLPKKNHQIKSIHYQFRATTRVGKVCETALLHTTYFRGFRSQRESL